MHVYRHLGPKRYYDTSRVTMAVSMHSTSSSVQSSIAPDAVIAIRLAQRTYSSNVNSSGSFIVKRVSAPYHLDAVWLALEDDKTQTREVLTKRESEN